MAKHLIPVLNYSQACTAVAACLRAKRAGLLVGSPGGGKCLGESTLVLMADGRVLPVECILPGDRLMGPDGHVRTVLSITDGFGPLYRITPIKGDPWICNDVHVLTLVHTNTGEVVDIPLDRYFAETPKFRDRHKQFSVSVDEFEGVTTKLPVDPYFLGVWFGDGTKARRQNAAGIQRIAKVAISKNDPEMLQLCEATAQIWDLRVKTYGGGAGEKCYTHTLVSDEIEGRWCTNRLLQTLRDVVGPKIEVPEAYLRAGRLERLQFLAGYLDADSELAQNCFIITQKREDWARSIWWLARSLGFCATIRPRTGRCLREDGTVYEVYEGRYWTVVISGDMDLIPTRLPRKKAAPRKQQKKATRTGITVSPVGEGAYYGFTLDGDGRFLLGDFTVTHNTSLVRDAARAINLPCHDLIASNMDPTDVAGLPYRDMKTGRVLRELFPEIRAVVDHPGVLFLDEATTMPKSVEGPLLRLALERNAGGMPLHEGSAILLACNPPDQAPGGIEMSAAMINRVVVMKYQPAFHEVQGYFNGEPVVAQPVVISQKDFARATIAEQADFAATLAHATDLIVYDPPRASIDNGEPWASPRGWEIGLDCLAAHGGVEDEVGFALLAGAVGPAAAGAYLGIRKLRQFLPSINEIKANPTKTKVPKPDDHQIAALGVLARVAQDDVWAAWVYAARMKPEIGAAAGRVLMNKVPQKSPHAKVGKKAQIDLLAKVKRHSA